MQHDDDDDALAVCFAAGYGHEAGTVARLLQQTAYGRALLANLCNLLAKDDAALYARKAALVLAAVRAAQAVQVDTWQEPHLDTRGAYPADTVIYIGHPAGRFSFHCRQDDPAYQPTLGTLPHWRIGWDGIAKQPIARQLITNYLEYHE